MNSLLEAKILKQYPVLLGELKTRFEDGQYFECGDGWQHLIVDLLAALEPIAASRSHIEVGMSCLYVTQVKEKLGLLRVYFNHQGNLASQTMVKAYVQFAEALSGKTCECCGERGQLRREGYIRTLCVRCAMGNQKS